MAHILICDNNSVFTAYLKDKISALFPERFSISVCSSAESLREEAVRKAPDIVLMDILLGEDNGIELAKEVFPRERGAAVIFISGYAEYCTDVYEAEHVYFLLKPIRSEQLRNAIEKALAALPDEENLEYFRSGYDAAQIAMAMASDINLVALKVSELSRRGYAFRDVEHRSDFLK